MLTNIQKRIFLFLFGCILTRTLFVLIAKNIPIEYLPYLSIPAFCIGIGFLYIYFSGSRKTGPEVFGEKIWWNNLRPVFGLLYITFAILALKQYKYAWVLLLLDVILGLTSFLVYHYRMGDFN